MTHLIVHETPTVDHEYMIIAFAGWADAAEAATTAIKYLTRKLEAKKVAELDPEEFYDFSQTRPYTSRTKNGRRKIKWPANEFFSWAPKDSDKGTLFYLGVEPNLRWRTFSQEIIGLAKEYGVKTVVHLGALLDAVPHTREVRLTGSSTRPDLQTYFEDSGVNSSKYQGPTGISSVLLESFANAGIEYASLWGHTSHYLQAAPNYRVAHTLLKHFQGILNLPVDIGELLSAAETFDREVAKAIERDDQLGAYVAKLEGQYDESVAASEIPDPLEMVQDMEQFLRSEQRRRPGRGDAS
ncbi:MAG: PAC2 family protein [Chloroflexi bacterium]|nr:PAC2 family protein [Chloroflexota bacterium]